jgi:glycosyltransferase involved in cell wall biosynthesis
MKIFSNDYLANIPTKAGPTKGGPAHFSRSLQNTLINKGDQWIGLVPDYYRGKKIKTELIQTKKYKNKKWWTVSLPKDYLEKRVTKAKQIGNPLVILEELISEIKKIIVREQPDVIFINGSSAFAWAYLVAAHSTQIPVVALYAGIWTMEIDQYSDMFTPGGIKMMKKMEKDFGILSDYSVFLNETCRDLFTRKIQNIPKSKIRIIPLPCESSKSNLTSPAKKNQILNVGIVARWDRIKNHKAYLDLVKEAQLNNKNWKFFAVTTIPKTKKFKEFKREYRKNIEVLEPMDKKKLQKFYRKMDFMILPSFFESASFVVLEAAFEGVPTFMSKNVGHANHFLKNGLSDFVVNFDNIKEAFKKIDAGSSKKYPKKFVNSLKKIHEPKRVFSELEKLFKIAITK